MFGFQAANAAPLVEGRPIEYPQTVATAIRIGNPASWDGAVNALKESDGYIAKVTDEELFSGKLSENNQFLCPVCNSRNWSKV